jgi:hypothetical protein
MGLTTGPRRTRQSTGRAEPERTGSSCAGGQGLVAICKLQLNTGRGALVTASHVSLTSWPGGNERPDVATDAGTEQFG